MYDAVGGGPAGTAAALTLERVHRTVLLIDAGEGRNAPDGAGAAAAAAAGHRPDRQIGRAHV